MSTFISPDARVCDNARAEVERLTAQTPLPLTERNTT